MPGRRGGWRGGPLSRRSPYHTAAMMRISHTSCGRSNIDEVYRHRQSAVKPAPDPILEPEARPQQPRLEPFGDFGHHRERIPREKRKPPPRQPAPPVRADRAQPNPIAIARAHDAANLADAVNQPAGERHAAGQHLAFEQRLVGGIDLAGAPPADLLLEGLMNVLLQRPQPIDV